MSRSGAACRASPPSGMSDTADTTDTIPDARFNDDTMDTNDTIPRPMLLCR
jgi:hypothetical protein